MALKIWYQSWLNRLSAEPVDPRMAFQFAEVAVGHEAEAYYGAATRLYLSALDSSFFSHYEEEFLAEVMRVLPLLSRVERIRYERLASAGDATVLRELAGFWTAQNPIMSTGENERLIEHWHRIAHAKAHFKRADNSPYGTDDRGTIYVRFGAPDRKVVENVTINQFTDPTTSLPVRLFNNASVSVEMWVYHLQKGKDPIRFLFGMPASGGRFGLQPGILSMIPVAGNRVSGTLNTDAFEVSEMSAAGHPRIRAVASSGRDSSRTSSRLLRASGQHISSRGGAEFLIKYAVLEQLAASDPYFDDLYESMTADLFLSRGNIESAQIHSAEKYNLREMAEVYRQEFEVPPSRSPMDRATRINLHHRVFRVLGEDRSTNYILAFGNDALESMPWIQPGGSGDLPSELALKTGLLSYNKDWQPITRNVDHKPFSDWNPEFPLVYRIMGAEIGERLILSQEVVTSVDNRRRAEVDVLATSGAIAIELPPDLSSDQSDLEASDIFVGRKQDIDEAKPFPFAPEVTPVFRSGDDILVYFELYNLRHSGGAYSIQYSFNQIEGDGKRRSFDALATTRAHFRSSTRDDRKWFGIQLDGFRAGLYEMVLTFDDDRGRGTQRSFDFTVTE